MKSATLAIVLTAGAIATTTSCTASQAAKPPVGEVPAVTQPHLNLSTYSGKPCLVFGVDQLGRFGVTDPGTPDAEQSTARCRWRADSSTIGITLFGATQGLSAVYATKGRFAHFEPTEVAKYPAVDRDTSEATTGTCATVVGIADAAAFEVNVAIEDEKATGYRTPCEVSKQVAAVALANIQGGG